MKNALKSALRYCGLNVEWRDTFAEAIPGNYERSMVLPRVYTKTVERILYLNDAIKIVENVDGCVVECGVSVGHGLLMLVLLGELGEIRRSYYGFDSFEGFPSPTESDGDTHAYKGYYANPPEVVLRVLRDGRVPEVVVRDCVRLVRGFFEDTLPQFDRPIALLHLDCDLYDSYLVCLNHLYPLVNRGGLIMFDEYDDPSWPGARKAIDEFFMDKVEKPRSHRFGKYFIVKE